MRRLLVLLAAVVGLALVQAPTLAALRHSQGRQLWVGPYNANDTAVYFAHIEQSRRGGGILSQNRFTPEPAQPLPMPYWYLLGKLGSFTSLPTMGLYLGAIVAAAAALLLAVDRFAERLGQVGTTPVAAWLAAAAGGVGWIGGALHLYGGAPALPRYFPDWFNPTFTWTAEASLSSHFFVAQLLVIGLLALASHQRARPVAAAIVAAAMGLVFPYGLPVVLVLAATLWVASKRAGGPGEAPRRATLLGAAAGAAATGLWYWLALRHGGSLSSWYEQNRIPSPHPLGLALAYLPLLPLVFFGLRSLWRSRADWGSRVLLGWLLVPLALAYLPLPYQRRVLDSYYLPVALVAAAGWRSLRLKPGSAVFLAALLAAALVATPAMRSALVAVHLGANPTWGTASADEVAALAWLDGRCRSGEAAVADTLAVRQWVPYFTAHCRTYGAHHELSVDFWNRKAELDDLLASASSTRSWAGPVASGVRYAIVSNLGWSPPSCAVPGPTFGQVRTFEVGRCGGAS